VPAGDSIKSGQDTPNITVKWSGSSGNVSVQVQNDCGTSNPTTLAVQVGQAPVLTPPIQGPASVCVHAAATFSVAPTATTSGYNWSIPSDATFVSGQGTDTIHVQWGNTAGEVSVFAENQCGPSAILTKTVGLGALPAAAGAITGKDTVCLNHGNYQFSVPVINGATGYAWIFPAGAQITAGAGTNQVTVTFGPNAVSGAISVKGTNTCGEGAGSSKNILVNNCAGIGENSLEASVLVYPNPVNGILTISLKGTERQLTLSISDISGQVRLTEKLDNIPSEYTRKIDMSQFAKGVYILTLKNSGRVYTQKVVVN
jgi:hypothetical protein